MHKILFYTNNDGIVIMCHDVQMYIHTIIYYITIYII